LEAPKKYELPKDEYISYPEAPEPSPEPTPEPNPEPTPTPEPDTEPTTDEGEEKDKEKEESAYPELSTKTGEKSENDFTASASLANKSSTEDKPNESKSKSLTESKTAKTETLSDIVRKRIDEITSGFINKNEYQKMIDNAIKVAKEKKSDSYVALQPMSIEIYNKLKGSIIKDEKIQNSNIDEKKMEIELKNIIDEKLWTEAAKEKEPVSEKEVKDLVDKIEQVFKNKKTENISKVVINVLLGREGMLGNEFSVHIPTLDEYINKMSIESDDKKKYIQLSSPFLYRVKDLADKNISHEEKMEIARGLLAELRIIKKEFLELDNKTK
jgi:hypothetical protein